MSLVPNTSRDEGELHSPEESRSAFETGHS